MPKIKTNYLAGAYRLIRDEERHISGPCGDWKVKTVEESTIISLSASAAKTLIRNKIYEKFGFKSIEFIGAD